jgi:hypothetical protein
VKQIAAALLLLAAPAFAGDDGYDDPPPIQRYLAELQLGDSLEDVQRIYPPAQDWPSHIDPRGRVTRYRVERGMAKAFPTWTQALLLGFKHGRLVDIQVVYDQKRSRAKTYEDLARDLSLTYGEADRTGDKFWWTDSRSVLRVFPVEVPTFKDGEQGTEWRTSIQVLEKDLFKRID